MKKRSNDYGENEKGLRLVPTSGELITECTLSNPFSSNYPCRPAGLGLPRLWIIGKNLVFNAPRLARFMISVNRFESPWAPPVFFPASDGNRKPLDEIFGRDNCRE
jgi:hypothetical protein